MKRRKLNRNKDQKIFRNTAKKTRVENIPGAMLLRGGRRL